VIEERHFCEPHAQEFLAAHPLVKSGPAWKPARPVKQSEAILAPEVVTGFAAGPLSRPAADDNVCMDFARLVISEIHDQQALTLQEVDGNRCFYLSIGIFEATALDRLLKGLSAPRPLTYDGWSATIAALGGQVQEVRITDLRETTYHAEIRILMEGRLVSVDLRPSDAFALALKCDAPIMVASRWLVTAEGVAPG
jgi:bifunctional DNase/RNase